MADVGLTGKSARELAKLIRERALSPVEVLEAHLASIETRNPRLNAVVTLVAEQARDDARRCEQAVMQEATLGPLHGLPVAIKDTTPTAGIRTTFASPLYKDYVPTEDAEIVRRLKAAGAIVLAKTNTPEFACGANTDNALFGATRNPWNADLSPAGSSGGSAVAAATGMVPIAQGTDFGGSLRVPAAFCGIVGIRPTPGLTPNYPMPLAWDLGQVHGALARDAEDAALMLDAMVGQSSRSPISVAPPWASALTDMQRHDPAKLRIAYVSDIAGIGVEGAIDHICRAAAARLTDHGAEVEQVELDLSDGRLPYQIWRGLWMVGQQFERLDSLSSFGANLRGNVEAGLKLTALDFAAAENKRRQLYDRVCVFFERFDVLLTPTAPVPPFSLTQDFPDRINGRRLDNYIDWIAPTFLISFISLPAASAPAGLTKDGLPIGIQIVAPRFAEPLILSVAKFIRDRSGVGWPPSQI